jgi:DNA modification methylase
MTELIWEGKYKDGQKVAPLRIKLPFQTVETINESAQERQRSMDLFSSHQPTEWRNRLIWGDKKYILPSLLEEFTGKMKLIYLDPPFATGQNFSFNVQVEGEEFTKQSTIIEQKAYRDTWGVNEQERIAGKTPTDKYLQWFYETAVLMKELLADNGSIFVHIDVHMGPYIKVVMDEVFGKENFQNEIAWYYYNKLHDSRKKLLPKAFDQILYYVKSRQTDYTYNSLKEKRDKPVKKLKYKKVAGKIQNIVGEDGKTVTYISEERTVDNVWRIRCLQPANLEEWVFYDTQKPVDLIERIIQIASNSDDLIFDPFVGSGSTAVAAERQGRRWIVSDLGRFAIHTTRKRLLSEQNIKPFIVQNLGKYERQLWQTAEFGDKAEATQLSYRRFILNLYNAQPVEGYTWLHGLKSGRMVYVGAVDSPVSPSDVGQIAAEFKRATGTGKDAPARNGVDVLGWDFAFELNEVAKQQAAQANINIRFIRIPREVLEKKAVEQGDIRFFELAALSVEKVQKGHSVTLTLTDFVIPQDDVPEDVRKAVTHWEQWIDYWSIDWNNREDNFHNEWQDYRTRKKRDLQKTISHTYEQPGIYIIMVKVIDILGNDTTKSLKVEVR